MIPQESLAYDSKSNEAIEKANQEVQGMVRSLKSAVEERLGIKIDPDSVVVPWLVRHAAAVLSRLKMGTDGKTAAERLKGKRFRREVCEFAETFIKQFSFAYQHMRIS